MRFYTRDWVTGGLTDEQWRERDIAYTREIENLRPNLPASVALLESGAPFGGIHDARVLAFAENPAVSLELFTGDLQRGYWEASLVFADASVRVDGGTMSDLVVDPREDPLTCLLYDELDRSGNEFAWRVLAWPTIEFEILFSDVAVTWSPRSGEAGAKPR
jgi:hypothetical protein